VCRTLPLVSSSGAPGGDQQTLLIYLNSYIGCLLSGASSSRSPALRTKPYLLPSLPTSIHHWNITPHLVPCVRLTLNRCSFRVSAHVSVLAALLLPLQLFGTPTPFLWPFVVVSPLTVFGANSKLSSITLLSGLLNTPPHPMPQIRRVSRRHCALYKFTYLFTYLPCGSRLNIPSHHIPASLIRSRAWGYINVYTYLLNNLLTCKVFLPRNAL